MDEWRKLLAWARTTNLTADEARAALVMAHVAKKKKEREELREKEFQARQMMLFQEPSTG